MIQKISYPDREAWLKLRRQYLGGSDAGAVMGLNPYKSAYTLWAEKTGQVPEFEGNITTKVGSYLEDFVAKLFTEETGKKVRRENHMLVNDLYPWACADVDRLVVGEDALLEIKTTNSAPAMRKFRNGEYPETWYCQMTHYLAVTGLNKAYLAVLIGCRDFQIFELQRDEDEIASLMAMEKSFWASVQSFTPPAADDGSESTTDTLTTLYPNSDGSTVDLFGRGTDLERYEALGKRIKELEAEKNGIAQLIQQDMGAAEKAICDGYKVSWKSQTRTSYDWKAFEKDHPGVLVGYSKTSTSRVFRVTK